MCTIPNLEDPGRYTLSRFENEQFVEITAKDGFVVDMQYPLLNMENAEKRCFVRRRVYEMLKTAQSKLPEGYRFCIWDAWRPFALQNELYKAYSGDIIDIFGLNNEPVEVQERVIRKYVSEPVADRDVPPAHTTGGSVDITIIDGDGKLLDMGTGFDEFTDRTKTSYFENEENEVVRNNRRLLYKAMTEAGFTNLPSEWWHYDYGNRFWAFYQQVPAIYRGVFRAEEMNG